MAGARGLAARILTSISFGYVNSPDTGIWEASLQGRPPQSLGSIYKIAIPGNLRPDLIPTFHRGTQTIRGNDTQGWGHAQSCP